MNCSQYAYTHIATFALSIDVGVKYRKIKIFLPAKVKSKCYLCIGKLNSPISKGTGYRGCRAQILPSVHINL